MTGRVTERFLANEKTKGAPSSLFLAPVSIYLFIYFRGGFFLGGSGKNCRNRSLKSNQAFIQVLQGNSVSYISLHDVHSLPVIVL